MISVMRISFIGLLSSDKSKRKKFTIKATSLM